MASDFKSLQIKRYPKLAERPKADTEYWKKFQVIKGTPLHSWRSFYGFLYDLCSMENKSCKIFSPEDLTKFEELGVQVHPEFPVIVKEYSAINHIDFCQAAPHDFLVTCSGKIQIFSPTTNQVKKTITRFKDNVYCGRFRNDGKLIVAGFENGGIKVFDASSRTILRQFKPHSKAAHVAGFLPETSHVYSASDDTTVKCMDIPTQKEVNCFTGHNDYIRTGTHCLTNNNVLMTGSYDHTVKLWDVRTQECTMSVDHEHPVESVLLYPNCGMCLSSGGNYVKVWDILAGGRLLFKFSNHQKTITTMCFDGSYTRLLSGSIDRHVKVYDTKDYSVVTSLDYSSAITSMGLSQSGSHLIVGMADGLISIKERIKKKMDDANAVSSQPRRGSYRYFVRGQSYKPQEGDFVVEKDKPRKVGKTDKFLQRFDYRGALDSVLEQCDTHPPKVIGLLIELARRDGLKIALSNRDANELAPMMNFLIKNVCNPRYSNILIDIAELILDIYTPVIGQSETADKLFTKLKNKLGRELEYQKEAFEVLGALDALVSSSTIPRTNEGTKGVSTMVA